MRGRAGEMGDAISVLRRTQKTGQSALILLTGGPGIGKTTFLDAVTEQARRLGYAVGMGKAEESDEIAPGAPLLVALRSGSRPLLDEESFGGLAALYSQHLWLVDRVAGLLEELTARTPVVIAIDDLQWADRLSRFALRILPGRLAGSPVVWLLTSGDPAAASTAEVSAAVRDGVPVLHRHLGSLGAEDLTAMAVARLGAPPTGRARAMLDGVDGNPFLAARLLNGLAAARAAGDHSDEFPDDLRRQVRARCASLPAPSAAVVHAAAVLGRPFFTSEAAALAGTKGHDLDPGWLNPLVEQGVLTESGNRVRFRHDLIREAVYADLPDPARRDLHQHCARFLLTSGQGAVAAAPHALAAAQVGDTESVAILRHAAEDCADADRAAAADLAMHAFDLTTNSDPAWSESGERAVELLTRAQRGRDAVRLVDRMLAELNDPESVARIQLLAARALWSLGRVADIGDRVEHAMSHGDPPEPLKAQLRAMSALTAARTETVSVARQGAETALASAHQLHDPLAEQLALEALGEIARNQGRHAAAYEHFRDLRLLVGPSYLAQEISALQLLDRYDDAATLLSVARSEAAGHAVGLAPSLLDAQMWQDFNLTRLDEAEVGAQTVLRLGEELGNHVSALNAQLILSTIALLRGDAAMARQRLLVAEQITAADDEASRTGLQLMSGWVTAEEGDVDAGVEILRPLLNDALTSRSYWPWWPGWMRLFTQIGVAAGAADFAREAARIAQVGADRNPGVRSFEGQALHLRGLLDQDLDMLGKAVDVLEGGPRPLLLAGAVTDHGVALLSAGQRKAGVAALDRAWHILHEHGVSSALPPLQRALQRAGARRKYWSTAPTRPVSGWASLTVGELRVAQLIGSGHANRSAADELGLSPNTVATHLRAIFAKLDVTSRVQLANALNDAPQWQQKPAPRSPLDAPIDVTRLAAPAKSSRAHAPHG